MLQKKRCCFGSLLFSFVTTFFYPAFSPASAANTRLVVAYSSINPNSSHLEIARVQGLFRKYGLDAEIILVRSSATATAGLAAGNIQVGYIGGSALLNAAAEGLPLKMLASFDDQLKYDIMARPEIKSVEQLKGKTFGVGSLGGTPWMAAKLAFERLNIDEKRDRVQVIAMANQTSRYQALGQGSIDAAILQGNYSRVLKTKGFTTIIDLERENIPFVGSGAVMSTRFARDNREIAENVLKALIDSQSFINGPQNKSAVIKIMGRYLREGDPAALEDGFHVLSANMNRKPYPSVVGLNNIRRLLGVSSPKAADLKAEELIDDRLLRKFDSGGLLDRALAGSL